MKTTIDKIKGVEGGVRVDKLSNPKGQNCYKVMDSEKEVSSHDGPDEAKAAYMAYLRGNPQPLVMINARGRQVVHSRQGNPLTTGKVYRVQITKGPCGTTHTFRAYLLCVDKYGGVDMELVDKVLSHRQRFGSRSYLPGDEFYAPISFNRDPESGKLIAFKEVHDFENGHKTFIEDLGKVENSVEGMLELNPGPIEIQDRRVFVLFAAERDGSDEFSLDSYSVGVSYEVMEKIAEEDEKAGVIHPGWSIKPMTLMVDSDV